MLAQNTLNSVRARMSSTYVLAGLLVVGVGKTAVHLLYLGRPIRYGCRQQSWPTAAYQTVFASEPGSAEMPSAARGFTPELVTALVAAGVVFAPLTLHTGVSSLEAGEAPYPERYRVPSASARLVNSARRAGGRVIAVGTTSARALETVADERGLAHPGRILAQFMPNLLRPFGGKSPSDYKMETLLDPALAKIPGLNDLLLDPRRTRRTRTATRQRRKER